MTVNANRKWDDRLDELLEDIEWAVEAPESLLARSARNVAVDALRQMASEADLWRLVPSDTRNRIRLQLGLLA